MLHSSVSNDRAPQRIWKWSKIQTRLGTHNNGHNLATKLFVLWIKTILENMKIRQESYLEIPKWKSNGLPIVLFCYLCFVGDTNPTIPYMGMVYGVSQGSLLWHTPESCFSDWCPVCRCYLLPHRRVPPPAAAEFHCVLLVTKVLSSTQHALLAAANQKAAELALME